MTKKIQVQLENAKLARARFENTSHPVLKGYFLSCEEKCLNRIEELKNKQRAKSKQ